MSGVVTPRTAMPDADPAPCPHPERFDGVARLYGVEAIARFWNARVCVVGIGGVGSWTVEALARSGVGHLTLVDLDDVCVTNTNRQAHTLSATVGAPKARVMADRVREISPAARVDAVLAFATRDTMDEILSPGFDVVIDAVDGVADKCALIDGCRKRGIACVVVGGAGGRRDAHQIRCADLAQTGGDGLLREVRRSLRREYGWSATGSWGVPTIFSKEPRRYPTQSNSTASDGARRPLRLDCATGFGAAAHLTGAFGFMAAGAALDHIASHEVDTHAV